jgi:hypothetical protein
MTISTEDVVALLGRDLTAPEEDRATRLIEMAESAVEAALPGFSFAAGSETVAVNWHDPNVFWTPRYPVTAVNRVTVNNGPVDATWVRFDEKGKIELNDPGDPYINRRVPAGWATVTIDYDFGLDPPPPVLAGVVASMVAIDLRRNAVNPGNVQAETIGSYSVAYYAKAEQAVMGAVMAVPALPRRWKRTAMISVPLARYR